MPNFPSPLPLAAFEEYMLRDDRPKYPMSMFARLRFAGQLDRRATTEALETVVARHPLLRAKVRKTRAGRLEWIAAADRPLSLPWIDGPEDDRLPLMRPIDLFSEPGLRAWATADSQRSSLVLQVHHATCDGKAVFGVLDDFLRSYAHVSAGKQSRIAMSTCNPETLPGRGRFGLTVWKYLCMLPAQLMGLSRIRMFFMQRPVPYWNASGQFPASCRLASRMSRWAAWRWTRCGNSRPPLRMRK